MLTGLYLATRRFIRNIVVRSPLLNRSVGGLLVRIDILLRKTGILNSVKRQTEFAVHEATFAYGESDAGIAEFVLTNGDYEEETRKVVMQTLKPGDVFFDLGANIGYFTVLAAKCVGPNGRVIAFEPTPATRSYLDRNVQGNGVGGIVAVEAFAISERRGTAYFEVGHQSECNSIATDGWSAAGTIEVKTIGIDEYCADYDVPRVDMVKMDIEGQELKAIRSMLETNRRNPQLKIVFEYNAEVVRRSGEGVAEFFTLLSAYGFKRFTALLPNPVDFKADADLRFLEKLAERYNINILASKEILVGAARAM
jgi:FkbM family methyltransferase